MSDEAAAPAPAETKPEGGSAEPITVRVRDQVSRYHTISRYPYHDLLVIV